MPVPRIPQPRADLMSQPAMWIPPRDKGAGPFPCRFESHAAERSWVLWSGAALGHPSSSRSVWLGTKSQHALQTLLLIACNFLPDRRHPHPFESKLTCESSSVYRPEKPQGMPRPAEPPAAWGKMAATRPLILGPLVVGWVAASCEGGSPSQNRKERPDGGMRGSSGAILHAWYKERAQGAPDSRGLTAWFPDQWQLRSKCKIHTDFQNLVAPFNKKEYKILRFLMLITC